MDQWAAPTLRWTCEDNTTDFPYASGLIAVRHRAGETLRPIFERYGELLPVDTEAGPLWLFRCLNIVDALAPTVRYEEGYRGYHEILDFDFVPDKVEGAGIFVIPKQAYAAEVFFTRDVAQEFLDADVRCPPFVHIWSVEAGV